jgi:malate dehydrogenase (quinone)
MPDQKTYDLVLVGGGIMSATLGVLTKLTAPEKSILVIERLPAVAEESSNAWNNAGTGHAALCELNYMPDSHDGSLPDPAKAIAINEQFQLSRQFWAELVSLGVLESPESFIRTVPHMTFVSGEKDVDYLARRFAALKDQPLFAGMQLSTDPKQIAKWAPLMMEGRATGQLAATFIEQGTDVDYGSMTRQMIGWLAANGVEIATHSEVTGLWQFADGSWQVRANGRLSGELIRAHRVFVGAGGWALKLLQKARIPEIRGYGTFPVSGHFLRTDNPELVSKHFAKVYSQAAVGAPPMSVPHLDTRVVDGKSYLLFGPFAGLNPKFLKHGNPLDLFLSVRPANLFPYLTVAIKNFGLVRYLIREISKSRRAKLAGLRDFVPSATSGDWQLYEAGQRAQVIKPSGKFSGTLQFGTEVISSADASIAGLLGASPGASVSTHVMLDVYRKFFAAELASLEPELKKLMPALGQSLNSDPKLAKKVLAETAKKLKLTA